MKPVFSNSHQHANFIKKIENYDKHCNYYLEVIHKINNDF